MFFLGAGSSWELGVLSFFFFLEYFWELGVLRLFFEVLGNLGFLDSFLKFLGTWGSWFFQKCHLGIVFHVGFEVPKSLRRSFWRFVFFPQVF